MNSRRFRKIVLEFSLLAKGASIENPFGAIYLTKNVRITRKALKHIVEQRGIDGLVALKIEQMLMRIPILFKEPEFLEINPNKTHKSYIAGKRFEYEEGLVVVFERRTGEYEIITAYYRPGGKFEKLKKKLKDTDLSPEGRNIPHLSSAKRRSR